MSLNNAPRIAGNQLVCNSLAREAHLSAGSLAGELKLRRSPMGAVTCVTNLLKHTKC